ncbi:MAG: helix-turn-helix transcriptional regulator [Oscillospiraceae bacterium]
MKIDRKSKVGFGALINKHRMKMPRDMNPLRKVAAACEMNFSTLNDIEKGDGFPTEPVVLKLSEALILSDSDRHDLLNKYSKIAEVAPPDIDRYLISDVGKAWWDILRLAEKKTISPDTLQEIQKMITRLEDKKDESTN